MTWKGFSADGSNTSSCRENFVENVSLHHLVEDAPYSLIIILKEVLKGHQRPAGISTLLPSSVVSGHAVGQVAEFVKGHLPEQVERPSKGDDIRLRKIFQPDWLFR